MASRGTKCRAVSIINAFWSLGLISGVKQWLQIFIQPFKPSQTSLLFNPAKLPELQGPGNYSNFHGGLRGMFFCIIKALKLSFMGQLLLKIVLIL